MLAGIGGRTIAEAKERLSYREFLKWATYRDLRGSLNLGMRIEEGSALLSAIYLNSKSSKQKFKLTDFMTHAHEPEMSLEEAMDSWH